jgi:RNA polymerase-binding transcription factor DksA
MDPALVAEFGEQLHERRSRIAPPLARATKSAYDLWTILHEREVAQIDAALARIRAGRFGVCTGCGGEVQYLHLVLDPASERCLSCKPRPATRTA